MPECGIGLVPDVGGSLLLARGPGRVGEYLALTTSRMDAGDAIYVGFADAFVPELKWPELIAALEETGDPRVIADYALALPETSLHDRIGAIDLHFGAGDLGAIVASLRSEESDFARGTLDAIGRISPLSAAVTVEMIGRVRALDSIEGALEMEFRATYRCIEDGDFVEGIRAAVIDKDRNPKWKHAGPEAVSAAETAAILAPLGDLALRLGG